MIPARHALQRPLRHPLLRDPWPLRRGRALRLAVAIGLSFAGIAGCAGPPAPAAERTPPGRIAVLADADAWTADAVIPLVERGAFRLARAEIDGRRAGLFLVDTGANRTVIAEGVAGRLGLERGAEVRASGVTGYSIHAEIDLPALRLAGGGGPAVELGTRTALGLSFHTLGPALRGGGGILGFTDLAGVPFTLKPARGGEPATLTLHRPAAFRPPAGATRHRLRRILGLPAVEATLAGRAGRPPVRVDLLLDTGASGGLSLPLDLLRRRPDLLSVPAAGAGLRRGVGGPGLTTQTWVRSLSTLGLTLRDVPTAFGPGPPGIRAGRGRVLGRLGQAVLRQAELTFDASRGWIWIRFAEPDARS
ncbi:aspartyl protease family protein [Phycisphaera mikurensis]|uniref:Peptidase A2 domain-containing protein n=1 Tax=Phycisphaera mikurensis (strain NBRC 102666 / KCTC 22515 / FYK2301M01) TaxID=1142394 RepID=I0IBT5_PHYMF|nr:aspartyl protease family protein [Phycisphaera mikurensis]MBB6442048.1 putative aspartyl protease [Phycisphaera mikurensis]BAM02723.1 hypothetical protein PSMK_05640 [Phycisphaera mikurensis NBRC 102666]